MMNIKHMIIFNAVFICIVNVCFAFDNKLTHIDSTKAAIKYSSLDSYVVSVLGQSDGIKTQYNGSMIWTILQAGSNLEDVPNCRAANHFHNPLLPWDQSQSTDVWPQDAICQSLGWTPRYSNITWATGLTAPDGAVNPRNKQNMGYDDARISFYNALTAVETTTRETLFAKTFQAVGQTLHLLQDMAVPAHVRNDFLSHLIYSGINLNNLLNPADWVANPFEAYVKRNPSLVTSIPQSQIISPSISGAMVSDLWDTDGRNGSSILQGLAESTNAGYFSDFTIPGNPHVPYVQAHSFPQPEMTATYTCSDSVSGSIWKRKYVSRFPCPTNGGSVDHLAAISMMTPRLLGAPPHRLPFINKYALDDNVHNTYAKELLPHTVGYSAALLDYFFRGKIEVEPVTASSTFQHFLIKIKNSTTTGEEMTGGDLALAIKYRLQSESGGVISPPTDTAPHYHKVVTLLGQYAISRTQQSELAFDLGSDPLPFLATDVTLQVVYRGQLGNEAGSVAVGTVALTKTGSDIALSLPASGVYATAAPNAGGFTRIAVNATSASDLNQPDGLFELVLKYRLSTSDPYQGVVVETQPADPDSFYVIRANEANGVNALQAGVARGLTFDISTTPLPLWASDVFLDVIYRRANAPEEKPLAIGQLDISEPTPVDVFNNTDRVCINNQWHVSGSPEAYTAAGVDVYGDPLDDIFSHRMDNVSFWTAGSGTLSLPLDPVAKNLAIAAANPGEVTRLGYILTDYTSDYAFDEQVTPLDPRDDWEMWYDSRVHSGTAFINQAGRGFSGMYTIRGKKMWWGASLVYDLNDESDALCGWETLPQ